MLASIATISSRFCFEGNTLKDFYVFEWLGSIFSCFTDDVKHRVALAHREGVTEMFSSVCSITKKPIDFAFSFGNQAGCPP